MKKFIAILFATMAIFSTAQAGSGDFYTQQNQQMDKVWGSESDC